MESKKSENSSTKTAGAKKCLMDQTLELLLKSKNENQQSTSTETINTINNLIRHVRKGCSKCPKNSVYLMISYYYFELFKFRLNKFKHLVIDKEFANQLSQTEDEEKDNKWDNIKLKKL